ncbi:YolD-like family protein [Domibacillus sp. A3M-37]|uniref:YolD-like family protein n=1 Tax=Domibacillus sp. A3M-37 TaxID=2962037 RepID=UPI0020B6C7DB|nr:YolD-like family protein [Domibacillus sp. A3M-37]MCP3763645.1 YolD-like family protein [Domibacillus sp. A3M-37]
MRKLYPDRGMLKWKGLILFEHADMMNAEKNKMERREILFDEQRNEEFNRIIHLSIHLKKDVIFELNTFGDDDLLKVNGVVSECSRIPGQKPYVKLDGFNSTFWVDEMVSIALAEGEEYGDAD